jgi:arginine decarboxylase
MGKEQERTPLFDAIRTYIEEDVVPMHIPAHKMGAGIHPKWKEFVGDRIFQMDLTEVMGLDDLHQASGVIQESQELAAKAWGADHSFFLVNGTSSGIVASICTVAKPGETIIIPRNAHKSVVFGLIVSGAIPIYISPEVHKEIGLVGGFDPHKLEEIYGANPHAKGVFSVSPTYHGICSDTKKLIEVTHRNGGVFIADEAHGNHVYFNSKFPTGALALGADLSCQSIHKMSGSLGQSSLLHVKGNSVDLRRLKANLQLAQNTSPSYLLMTSLDLARSYMATEGSSILDELIDRISQARIKISKIPYIDILGKELVGTHGIADYEPTRLVVSARRMGIEGYQLFEMLRKDYRIEIEYGDYFYGVSVLGLGTKQEHLDRLISALEDISNRYGGTRAPLTWDEELPPIPPQILSPRDAYFAETEKIPWENARGRISAELIVPYPPGIPALCPGEEITNEIWEYLEHQGKSGRHLHGVEGKSLSEINVLIEA